MNKDYVKVIDNSDTVASRLNVLTCLLRSEKFETLDANDICCAHTLILDTLEECVSILRNEVLHDE